MSVRVTTEVPLAPYTTMRVGGAAAHYVSAASLTDVEEAHRYAKERQLPLFVLGGGSNVVVADAGYAGVVLRIGMRGYTYHNETAATINLTCAAGELLDDVVAMTVAAGYWGLENLSLIPGTVGATPVQNVGAYGVEVADIITEVVAFDREIAREVRLTNTDCQFGYRDSHFKRNPGRYIIVAVTFLLSKVSAPQLAYRELTLHFNGDVAVTPALVREEIIRIRQAKFPDWTVVGTAGSFFKNPCISAAQAATLLVMYPAMPQYPQANGTVKVSLGFILDKVCGLRGYQVGKVGLYEKQALVLIAYPGATAREIFSFSEYVKECVFEKTTIEIECEVQFIS